MNRSSFAKASKRAVPLVALCATILVASPVARGTEDVVIGFRGDAPFDGEEYWTQERMENAIPMPLPSASEEETELGEAALLEDNDESSSEGAYEPQEEALPMLQVPLYSSEAFMPEGEQSVEEEEPTMVSSKGYPFTTRRASPDSTVNYWPFRLAGKFFFRKPDGRDYVCSASIIQRRIVVTAGHCVYDRASDRWYSNFLFVPAYNGNASPSNPYCSWWLAWAIVPGQWAASSGYPTSDDFALVEIGDRTCGGRTPLRIGAWLGWLGWSTYRLIGNNVTQLGYPENLDDGDRMQVSQSNVYRRTSYAGEIGSAQGGGTSGGPWIQNFGIRPTGQVSIGPSGYTGGNQVVGVSSYGNVNHDPNQYGGSSVLNNNFVRIWNTTCAHRSGNCTP